MRKKYKLPTGPVQAKIVVYIESGVTCPTAMQIARALRMKPVSIYSALTGLEFRGLVAPVLGTAPKRWAVTDDGRKEFGL